MAAPRTCRAPRSLLARGGLALADGARGPGDARLAHGRRQTHRHARRDVAHVAQARRVQRREVLCTDERIR